MLVGDFNMDLCRPDRQANDLLDFMANNGLLQTVTLPTRTENDSQSMIDHCYIKSKLRFNSTVITTGISDHCPTATTALDNYSKKMGEQVNKRWLNNKTYVQLKDLLGS